MLRLKPAVPNPTKWYAGHWSHIVPNKCTIKSTRKRNMNGHRILKGFLWMMTVDDQNCGSFSGALLDKH